MKIAILTTQTIHHAFFVREISRQYDVMKVFLETDSLKAPFETYAGFETTRDEYEKESWFGGREKLISDFAATSGYPSMNSAAAIEELRKLSPDTVVVFGTGKLSMELIKACENNIINLHGGDPEEYRGLDSHYWAVYHNDFSGLLTTIHRVNPALDDGDVILKSKIPLHKGMQLHQLRRFNSEICVDLTLKALAVKFETGHFGGTPQSRKGRYYSFMPACLKEICRRKFQKYTEAL
jgi:methionyl-tRNA formyltransferase